METIRLQKYFTDCGILSRRVAEAEIAAGRVKVNGEVAEVGQKILPGVDCVEYRGQAVLPPEHVGHTYVMLNKPRGYITSMADDRGRRCVTELVAGVGKRIYPVGRLDLESEGLLLLTNDGDLTYKLTHPRHKIPKIYHVKLDGNVSEAKISALSQPIELDGYLTKPVEISLLNRHDGTTTLRMVLYEGRNRQIRRMCAAQGLTVLRLCRVAIGDLKLGNLAPGKWRYLTRAQVEYLKSKK